MRAAKRKMKSPKTTSKAKKPVIKKAKKETSKIKTVAKKSLPKKKVKSSSTSTKKIKKNKVELKSTEQKKILRKDSRDLDKSKTITKTKTKNKTPKAVVNKPLTLADAIKAFHDKIVQEHQNLRQLEHVGRNTGNISSKRGGMQMNRIPRTMHHSRGR